jgi:aromatic-L-amino-acid decarboxylase
LSGDSLDPSDWSSLRALGHRMLDDLFDDLAGLREGKVWQEMPTPVRDAWQAKLPRAGADAGAVYDAYRALIAPYAVGNRHPRFFGWVHGGGTAVGMLAELLAGGLNANCGGRDHAPIACERQVIAWAAEMLGMPADSSGLLVTGTSMANFVAVLVARTARLGAESRTDGIGAARPVAYAAAGAHMCIARALEMAGIGSAALRLIPGDETGAIDVAALRAGIAADAAAGALPFLVVGTAGSVDTGAIDDLAALAALCRERQMWFHVDAAFGAVAMLSPALRPRLVGIGEADSVAFDFHKWAQVPYDAGCIVVRDAAAQLRAFARGASYLGRQPRGLAAGEPWPVDLGPDLSRGFRALKVWMMFRTYGADRIGQVAERCCALAVRLAARIDAAPELVRVAPVGLNIVCFRVAAADDAAQEAIAADLQLSGELVLSTTVLGGCRVLRAAIVNHRTTEADVDAIVPAVLAAAQERQIVPRR